MPECMAALFDVMCNALGNDGNNHNTVNSGGSSKGIMNTIGYHNDFIHDSVVILYQ